MTEEEKKWIFNKRIHISKALYDIKRRAKAKGIEFNLDHKYLCAIAPDFCPIFKQPLVWGQGSKEIAGHAVEYSPSLDRIIAEKGYVKGNVAWISMRANSIKNNATEKELYAVADWLHQKRKEVINGGARPPAFDDPANTYLVIPAHTRIAVKKSTSDSGGD